MAAAFAVVGVVGEYSDASWRIMSIWTSNEAADRECLRLETAYKIEGDKIEANDKVRLRFYVEQGSRSAYDLYDNRELYDKWQAARRDLVPHPESGDWEAPVTEFYVEAAELDPKEAE